MIKIIECTHLSILRQNIPKPHYEPISLWYSDILYTKLLYPMLQLNPLLRPTISTVIETIVDMIQELGGQIIDHSYTGPRRSIILNDNDDDDHVSNYNVPNSSSQYRDYIDGKNHDDDDDNGITLSRVV